MVTNSPHVLPHAQLWTGLATYKGALYRVEIVSTNQLWEADARRIVKKAGGHARSIDLSGPVDLNDALVYSMVMTEAKYDVRFTPDTALTNGALNRRPVTVRLKGNYSRVKDGELQKLHPALRNPPRPQPMQGQLRHPLRR